MTKIFIDFDQTLFDSAAMLTIWAKKLADKGVDPAVVLRVFRDNLKQRKALSLDGILDDFAKEIPHFPRQRAKVAALSMFGQLKDFVYPDVWPFLDKAREFDLNIISAGERTLQTMRIKAAGLAKYFNEIICTIETKESVLKPIAARREKIILIDDNALVIDAMEKAAPTVVTVWLNRPNGILSDQKPQHNDFTVNDFGRFWKLLQKIR